MPRSLRPTLIPGILLLGLLPVSCASQRPVGTIALEAPVPSPPAHASVKERIRYWEGHLPRLSQDDQSEARQCLGELYLESGNANQARINFYAARKGPQSKLEAAQSSYGIGRSYLLEQRASLAKSHLFTASKGLSGPEGEECQFLLLYASGKALPQTDSTMMARLKPFLGSDVRTQVASSNGTVPGFADVSRRDWGAAPLLANHDPMAKPFRLTIHHTAEPATTKRLADSYREMRDLQRMHQQGEGWADLGYHYLIDQAGRVLEGRPMHAQGAHAGNSELNRGNIGICLIGNFFPQPERGDDYAMAQIPSGEQMAALDRLTSALQNHYGITDSQIWGHQDLKQTACPGPFLHEWVHAKRGD
jgi:hypothetical protein